MILGSFDIETDVLKKIEDGDILLQVAKINSAVKKSNYSVALMECEKAIDLCSKDEDRVYCIYTKALILYYANKSDECCKLINKNISKFKKVFKYYSLELCRIYTMLWHCNFRRKKYLKSIINLCNCTYLSGVLQTICFIFILSALVKRISIDIFYVNGQFMMTFLSGILGVIVTIILMFFFNKALQIPKKEI